MGVGPRVEHSTAARSVPTAARLQVEGETSGISQSRSGVSSDAALFIGVVRSAPAGIAHEQHAAPVDGDSLFRQALRQRREIYEDLGWWHGSTDEDAYDAVADQYVIAKGGKVLASTRIVIGDPTLPLETYFPGVVDMGATNAEISRLVSSRGIGSDNAFQAPQVKLALMVLYAKMCSDHRGLGISAYAMLERPLMNWLLMGGVSLHTLTPEPKTLSDYSDTVNYVVGIDQDGTVAGIRAALVSLGIREAAHPGYFDREQFDLGSGKADAVD